MTSEEVERNIKFILEMQAQFEVNLGRIETDIGTLRDSIDKLRDSQAGGPNRRDPRGEH
jgi:hypothetical protein